MAIFTRASFHHGLAAVSVACLLAATATAATDADVIGAPRAIELREPAALFDLARANGIGVIEVRAANPGLGPELAANGRPLALPTRHVLPDAPRQGIVINLPEMRLYYFAPGGEVLSYPIGSGRAGKETPLGATRVVRKAKNPVWYPTRNERAEDPTLPARVGPGPDNQLGSRSLYLDWPELEIHGTNDPTTIGRRSSHGCVKLFPEDIEALYELVPLGTTVLVVNQPVKLGRLDGALYLQVHPEIADLDAIAAGGAAGTPSAVDAEAMIREAAGGEADRLDWNAARAAVLQRSGLTVRLTAPQ